MKYPRSSGRHKRNPAGDWPIRGTNPVRCCWLMSRNQVYGNRTGFTWSAPRINNPRVLLFDFPRIHLPCNEGPAIDGGSRRNEPLVRTLFPTSSLGGRFESKNTSHHTDRRLIVTSNSRAGGAGSFSVSAKEFHVDTQRLSCRVNSCPWAR